METAMTLIVYKTPSAGLHVRADGLLLPEDPLTGVVDASASQAPLLSDAFIGGAIHMLADEASLGDVVGDLLHVNEDVRQGIGFALELADTIVLVADAIELGIKIAEWMSDKPEDPLIRTLRRIDAGLSRVEDATLAAWKLTRQNQLDFLQAHSSGALSVAQKFLENPASIANPLVPVSLAIADRDSKLAVDTMMRESFWQRPNNDKLLVGHDDRNSWLKMWPERASPDDQGLVWDYRWALPALCYAIVARIAVIRAVDPQSLKPGKAGCREIKRYARFLGNVHARMQAGIQQFNTVSDWTWTTYTTSGWAPFATVDLHSGLHVVRWGWDPLQWTSENFARHFGSPDYWTSNVIAIPKDINELRANAKTVTQIWWNIVWWRIGLSNLCVFISSLENLCVPSLWSRSIADSWRAIGRYSADPGQQRGLHAAIALSRFDQSGDPSDRAIRTANLYRVLRRAEPEARSILQRAIEDLVSVAEVPQKERVGAVSGPDPTTRPST
jgi:hypothetical protein